MGNSSTKESRPRSSSSSLRPTISPSPLGGGSSNSPRRGSRHDLSFLGIRQHEDREPQPGVLRVRETKQEREARKLERERIAREKERERSMKEEGVDGGYLVTLGVYTGVEDYSKPVVRQLMIERRLAPFWRGLNDFSESWVEHQLVAAGRGQPIPAADEIPPDYEASLASKSSPRASDTNVNSLTVPISSRSHSFNSSTSNLPLPSQPTVPEHPSASLPVPTSSSSPFRPRSKTLATLTSLSKGNSSSDMTQREVTLPKDPFINGQHIEAYLYKDASECPICFLYYPPYLNKTRCCDQPICSECFVQIKRPDPHPPEHGESSPPPSSADNTASQVDSELVSEAATCPYCNQPDFGVSYEPPPFRRGLVYAQAGGRSIANVMSAMSSSSSLSSSGGVPSGGGRRRAHSLSATDPSVITTDKVRPDWASKLATARAQQARRAAAATALHTAAYLMGPNSEGRSGGAFSRRSVFMPRRGDSPESGSGTPRHIPASNLSALLAMSERRGSGTNPLDRQESQGEGSPGQPDSTNPRRRTRIDDLEDMMMMEAIRMSLASEEERRKREEKEAKKEAKRKEKEAKKAEKVARKTGLYASGNESNSTIERSSASGPKSEAKGKTVDRTGAGTPPVVPWAPPSEESSSNGTSFLAEGATTPQEHLSIRRAQLQPSEPIQMPASPSRPSHLRHVSNASSTSSIGESAQGTPQFGVNISGSNSSFTASASNSATNLTPAYDGSGASSTPLGTSAGGGAGVEPMFNFRSLAAMIGEEEKSSEGATHVEHAEPDRQNGESVEIGEKSNVEGSSSKTEEPAMKDETVEKIKEAPEDGPSSSTVNGEVEAEKVAVDHASEDSSTTEMVGANGKHKEGISVTDARAEDSLAVHEV